LCQRHRIGRQSLVEQVRRRLISFELHAQLPGAFSIITRAGKRIELMAVTKTYAGAGRGFTALNHIDLKIPAGLRYGSN
jgi:hypothetical protein